MDYFFLSRRLLVVLVLSSSLYNDRTICRLAFEMRAHGFHKRFCLLTSTRLHSSFFREPMIHSLGSFRFVCFDTAFRVDIATAASIARSMPIPQSYCQDFNPTNETIPKRRSRPKLIEFYNSTNIVLDRFTARNSPFWFIHPFLSKNISMTNLTVLAPRAVGNTDGLDPDSCESVLMDSCYIDVGDDAVSIKVGLERRQRIEETNHSLKRAASPNRALLFFRFSIFGLHCHCDRARTIPTAWRKPET